MKVMVLVKATPESEAGILPTEDLLRDMGNYNEELWKAGIIVAGEGLQPSSKGVRVRFSGQSRIVCDGPFAETKELVAGYWIWEVKSMEEAVEWVKRCPNPMLSDSDIEIRPVYGLQDFGEVLTPELREQEERLAANLQASADTEPPGSRTPPRFESGPAMKIAGIKGLFGPANREQIPEQWARFISQLDAVSDRVGTSTYGVCLSYNADHTFEYLSGVEVGPGVKLPPGFTTVDIPAQTYAVFTHAGHVSQIPQTIDAGFKHWLPTCGRKMAESPSFERYTEAFNPQTGTGGIEIWIPLQ